MQMIILSTLLQVNGDMGKFFGITNIPALYDAGVTVANQLVKICSPVVGVALLIKIFTIITKIFNERQVDFFSLGKTFLLILFLFQYTEVMTQVNGLMSYFTENVQSVFDIYGSGHTVVDKINLVFDKYQQNHPDPSFFDHLSNVGDWIIATCTHLIIILSRAIIYIVRSLILVFLYAVGPIAILASMFPGFEENLKHWLKYYIMVGFWTVTLAILDLILYQYLDYCEKNSTIDGLTTVNIGIALMYLIVPYLTSRYIGGQGSQFISKMVQMATVATAMTSKVGKGAGQALNFSGGSGGGNSVSSMQKARETLSGGSNSNSMASSAGRAYGRIKNNIINRNKAE
jgi:hypothetical protein